MQDFSSYEAFFQNNAARVLWQPDKNIVAIIWQGFALTDLYRKALDKALDLLKAKKSEKLLMDNSSLKVVAKPDQEWTMQDWHVRLVNQTSIKKIGIFPPTDLFAQLAVKNILSSPHISHLQVQSFDTLEEAEKF